uniref:Bicarbonate transporter-like transmembrane domain-containing protein n=1 Tax=Pseudictyota dubia TaxID=2749911 RepID=A0A6U2JP69_9STRA
MVLATVFALDLLRLIPVPVLYGVFLFMGIVSLASNEFWHRFNMLFMQRSRLPDEPFTKYIAHGRTHMYTLIQVFIFVCLVVFRSIPQIAVAFPIIIKLCIPIRSYLLPLCFSKDELILLDGESPEIKKLVKQFEKEGHNEEMVLRESKRNLAVDDAAFDYADERTRA